MLQIFPSVGIVIQMFEIHTKPNDIYHTPQTVNITQKILIVHFKNQIFLIGESFETERLNIDDNEISYD